MAGWAAGEIFAAWSAATYAVSALFPPEHWANKLSAVPAVASPLGKDFWEL